MVQACLGYLGERVIQRAFYGVCPGEPTRHPQDLESGTGRRGAPTEPNTSGCRSEGRPSGPPSRLSRLDSLTKRPIGRILRMRFSAGTVVRIARRGHRHEDADDARQETVTPRAGADREELPDVEGVARCRVGLEVVQEREHEDMAGEADPRTQCSSQDCSSRSSRLKYMNTESAISACTSAIQSRPAATARSRRRGRSDR